MATASQVGSTASRRDDRERNGFLWMCSLTLLAYALLHRLVFGAALDNGTWEHVLGSTRIIVPDTFAYLTISQAKSVTEFLFLASIKNSIAPSLVWLIFRQSWVALAFFNAFCFYFALLFTKRLVILLDPEQGDKHRRICAVLTFACLFYSVGSLKEIPTLLAFTAVVYHFLANNRLKTVFWFLLLVAFRFQFSFLVVVVYVFSKVRRNPFRLTLFALATASALFPLLSGLNVFTPEGLGFFRAGSSSDSLGSIVEYARSHVVGVSLFAVLVRVVQSIIEPVIAFNVIEDGSLNLYELHALIVLFLLASSWVTVFFKRFRLVSDETGSYANFGILYSFLAVAIVAIGGMGIISHRFLVPAYGLLLVSAKVSPQRAVANATSRATPLPPQLSVHVTA